MKIKMQCIKTYETVIQATELVSKNLLTGEVFPTGIKVPENRWTTTIGKIITVTKGDGKKLVKSGNWMQLS